MPRNNNSPFITTRRCSSASLITIFAACSIVYLLWTFYLISNFHFHDADFRSRIRDERLRNSWKVASSTRQNEQQQRFKKEEEEVVLSTVISEPLDEKPSGEISDRKSGAAADEIQSSFDSNQDKHKHDPLDRSPLDVDKSQEKQQEKRDFLVDHPSLLKTLTAYIEPPFQSQYYTDRNPPPDPNKLTDRNEPMGEPILPLPLRTQSPSDLRSVLYPKVTSCKDIPHNLPVDPGFAKQQKNSASLLLENQNNKFSVYPHLLEEVLPHCPVDSDPFLPWIHDVFSTPNGTSVKIIAHNKRRCNTGNRFFPDVWNLNPQIALLQPVALKRLDENDSAALLNTTSRLWSAPDDDGSKREQRYRLANHDDADDDGKYTRFICRFHSSQWQEETLSTYPFNYEYVHYRKLRSFSMITKRGKDNSFFWLANLEFDCPVPKPLQRSIVEGTVEGRVYLDIVPIRTAPRFNERFIEGEWNSFDADQQWGNRHVLPSLEASGRWENIPVCKPPAATPKQGKKTRRSDGNDTPNNPTNRTLHSSREQPHYLVACLWASSSYLTRAAGSHVNNTKDRLIEWIEYHTLVGFDHFYIYDNSYAHTGTATDTTDLSFVLQHFGPDKITHIPWPFRVCNNNAPGHENPGTRSSQYTAEASCRARYGPYTEWMATFDTDEYLVPMGRYESLKEMLKDAKNGGANILSFRSSKALLCYEHTVPYSSLESTKCNITTNTNHHQTNLPTCLTKSPNTTYLQSYNCDRYRKPNHEGYTRAKKQIYRPSHVLSHFVHYSTVTRELLRWSKARHSESRQSERFTDEQNEAVMLHARNKDPEQTHNWFEKCKVGVKHKNQRDECHVGFPGSSEQVLGMNGTSKEGYLYNSLRNERLEHVWVPRLMEALRRRKEQEMRKQNG